MRILLVLLALAGVAAAADVRAGRAAVVITPPPQTPMAGYYFVRLSTGVHDELHAKTIVLEVEGSRAALIALDLVAAPREVVEKARDAIYRRTGLSPERVMISATHSHTGPEMGLRLKGVDPQIETRLRDYLDRLPGLIAQSVEQALADLRPARIQAAKGHEDSLSFIRRFRMKDGSTGWNPGKRNPNIIEPLGAIDPEVPVVTIESPKGEPRAVYVNFANHLDTVGGLDFSADYPFALGRALAGVHGDGLLTLFTIGCAGQINHLNVSSSLPQKGHSEAARIGTVLAGSVLKAMSALEPQDPSGLMVRREMVPLALAPFRPEEVAEAREVLANYGTPNARPFYDQVRAFKVLELDARKGQPYEAEVQVIALGKRVAWVALPGEIFVELGRSIKLRSPFPHTIVVELANGTLGYVPDQRAYPQGAYEVISARVAAGGGEKMVDSAVKMLLELHKEAGGATNTVVR